MDRGAKHQLVKKSQNGFPDGEAYLPRAGTKSHQLSKIINVREQSGGRKV